LPRTPNALFRAARHRRGMTRPELADAANQVAHADPDHPMDFLFIAKIEQGFVTWPSAERRAALRTVLEVHDDAEIGLVDRRTQPGTATR
jgi:transcriptional regulator with XRE-family HTH domain